MKLVYIGQRGAKGVEILWEEGEGSSLEARGTNSTYSKYLISIHEDFHLEGSLNLLFFPFY